MVLNIRDFGAIGDGKIHRVSEWIATRRFRELRTLQGKMPFVDSLNWTVDEVAFALAKAALPPEGGTIHFPAGHYVTGQYPWRIWRDHVRLTGEGAEVTILSTAPTITDALSVSPYRHAGWLEGAGREFAYAAEDGGQGETRVRLKKTDAATSFEAGELIFIRGGANRYDQDYGEFNEVAAIDPATSSLVLKHPLSRNYSLANLNWAGEIAEDFEMPAPGRAVRVKARTGDGFALPSRKATVSVGDNLFTVDRAEGGQLSLANCAPGNAPRGTRILAGTKIAKSRSILKLTRSTRDFRCEKLQIVGNRKSLNLSNSYDTAFADCVFVRDARNGAFTGGVTIDGDGGRFARFERCTIEARPAAGMQFARSFGGVTFADCHFIDANAAFTEFNFDCEVTRCTFDVKGSEELTTVIVAGKSCGGLRFTDNRIRAIGVAAIFDNSRDIQAQKQSGDGGILIRGNIIQTSKVSRVFPLAKSERFAIEDNSVLAD